MNINPPCVARKKRSVFRDLVFTQRRTRNATNESPRGTLRFMRATVAGLATLIVSATTFAAGQSSPNFVMQRDAINNGVGQMSSTNFSLSSSVGDAVAGEAIGSVNFQLKSGFRATVIVPPAVLNLLNVFSRKFHNGLPFDLPVVHVDMLWHRRNEARPSHVWLRDAILRSHRQSVISR